MDTARVFPCVVCTNKHLISKREKKRMLLKYIDGNMDVITHISEYCCLKEASTFNHFLTTRLQYKTLKYLRAILSIIRKLSVKLSINIHTSTLYMCGPLTCEQRAHFFVHRCKEIIKNSYILGEYFLKIDMEDELWRDNFDESIYLMYRINRSLWSYNLKYHPRHCRDCKKNIPEYAHQNC